MRITTWFACTAVLVTACTSNDDAMAKFVGSWAYAPGSTASLDCDGSASSVPFDTVVETFAEADGLLVKHDSQGCAGLEFAVSGDVASLGATGQSCTTSSAVFAPSMYSFTIAADASTLTEALTASYTPDGAAAACTVTAANTLAKDQSP
jgi:hypothetical protein